MSTADQAPELQLDEVHKAGCTRIWTDRATGTRADRPELTKVLDHMRAGDTIVVWRFDRLARSLSDLIKIATQLSERDVGLRSLREDINTTTPGGRLIFHVFGALAEFEAALMRRAHERWPSSALVGGSLLFGWSAEWRVGEVDGLLAGAAAAGRALKDGLQEQHGLWQCQAGRGRFGFCRSRVRKPWAAVTSAQWW